MDYSITLTTSPSVSIIETDSSITTSTPSNNIAAFIGEFEKGEINKPLLITSKLDFKQNFGRARDWNYNSWYQVYNYLEYSSPIWVCRTAGEINIKSSNNGNIANSVGEWGNLITVVILNREEYFNNKFINILGTNIKNIVQEHRIDGEWQILVLRHTQIMEFFSVDTEPLNSLYIEKFNLESGEFKLTGGFSDRATVEDLRESTFIFEKEDYVIDIIIGNELDNNIAIELAEYRKDCIAFIGLPIEVYTFLKANGKILITNNRNPIVTNILKFNKLTTDNKSDVIKYINSLTPSQFTFFTLGFKKILDNFDGKNKIVNIAGDIAGLKGLASYKNPWNVGIGMNYGIKNYISTSCYYSQEDKDLFFELGVNLLQNNILLSERMFIWDDKTTALGNLSVRNMLNYIERECSRIVNKYVFEFTDNYIENRIYNDLNLWFKDVAYNSIVDEYLIKVEKEKNLFIINIYIKYKFFINYVILKLNNAGTRLMSELSISE